MILMVFNNIGITVIRLIFIRMKIYNLKKALIF